MRRRPLFAALATAALLFAGGCGGDDGSEPESAPSSTAPQRIVSLSATGTEILYAIGAGPQVVAVDDQSSYPAEAPKTDLSGLKPNAEAIAAQDPDLVVLSNDTDKISSQLDALNIQVLLSGAAEDLDGVYDQIRDLGTATGHEAEADALTKRMRDDIDKIVADVPQRAKPLSYYYELDPTLYSVTSDTFIGSIFKLFGMTNVADAADADGSKGGYPQLSQEVLVEANPDTIFLADTKCCKQDAKSVSARSGWSTITAVRTGQIFPLDDDIASRWGPRTVDLVRSIADAVAKVPA